MRRLSKKVSATEPVLLLSLLMLSSLLGFSTSASAALVEYSGAKQIIGSDGVSRNVQVWMIFDDQFVKYAGTPPPLPGGVTDGRFGHFNIVSVTVHVEGLGVFTDTNGRLNIWYQRNPTAFTYYTEELEVLERHGMMKFLDGSANPWSWSPWLASPAAYRLPPELMIPWLNISPTYSYFVGDGVHLFRVCRCPVKS